jgi:hypothetical protein
MEVKLTLLSATKHVIIDSDPDPSPVQEGLVIERHERGGLIRWPVATAPASSRRKNLNATVLDYLLKNTHLIPGEWKGEYVLFWGTVYRDVEGLYVRCLHWCEDGWHSFYSWLDKNGQATTLEQHPHIDL